MPYIQLDPVGRLGNAMFRYLICKIFVIEGGFEEVSPSTNLLLPYFPLTDDIFCSYGFHDGNLNSSSIEAIKEFLGDRLLILAGYFQHDIPIAQYKDKLLQYILDHPDENMYLEYYGNYNTIKSSFMLYTSIPFTAHENVLHIRLGDFFTFKTCIHPKCYIDILKEFPKPITVICDKINEPHEYKYIEYIKAITDCTLLQNSVEEDYHIMKNAKNLICSMSTLSWMAAFWNNCHNHIYMPKTNNITSSTFQYPSIKCTIYNIEYITKDEAAVLQFNI